MFKTRLAKSNIHIPLFHDRIMATSDRARQGAMTGGSQRFPDQAVRDQECSMLREGDERDRERREAARIVTRFAGPF